MSESLKPAITPAREGRELQRYGDDGQRLTAGCVVLREVSFPALVAVKRQHADRRHACCCM